MTHKKLNILLATVLMMLIFIDWQTPVPFIFYGAIFSIYILINGWGTLFISSNFFLPAKCKAPITSGSVAITFDDGPVAERTERVLEILKKHNAKATFFCIGKNVKEFRALAKQIHDEGHLIGNHSYHHGTLFDLQSTKKMKMELTDTNQIIQQTIGRSPRFFRPPYGITNPMLANAVKELNFVAIGWSVRSFDTIAKEKEKLFTRITKNLKSGDIILLHDRCEITIEILPQLLTYIHQNGLKVEPLDKLLGEKAYR
jgi:peptidoglycan-N-acetylglucosamine deacetylase